jgi:hypothetical protein
MRTLFAVIAGTILGLIGLPLATLGIHWLIARKEQSDAQYGVVLLVAGVVGTALGVITGASFALRSGGAETPGRIVACVGGCVIILICISLGLTVFSGSLQVSVADRIRSVGFWFGLPLVWAVMLAIYGVRK